MKKLLILLSLVLFYNCTNTSYQEIEIPKSKKVVFQFETTEPVYDEVMLTYYDYKTDTDITAPYPFTYDATGNSLPLDITFENYQFKYVRGTAYRNNNSTATLSFKLFVNDELVLEDIDQGSPSKYATVNFDYTIVGQ